METDTWPANDRTEYSTLMLIHSIFSSKKERISSKVSLEQRKMRMLNSMFERAKEIAENIGMNIDQAEKIKEITWKIEIMTKIKKNIQQRLTDDLKEKTILKGQMLNKRIYME